MSPTTLRTERLVLDLPRESDVDAIFEACQDAGIQLYTTVPSPYSREDAVGFIARTAEQWAEGAHLTWAMRRDGELVGVVGLYRISEVGSAELGYWVAPDARGGGLIAEASRAVLDWGFEALSLRRIEWHARVGNEPSARVARGLGFRYEGVRRMALRNGAGVYSDGWLASLLNTDDRTPQRWSVLG